MGGAPPAGASSGAAMIRSFPAAALALALAALPAAAQPAASAPAPTYRVEAPKSLRVKKGVPSRARLEVVPRADSHISPDAPVSVAVQGSPSLEVPQARLGRTDAKETPQKGIAFEVPFAAKAAGAGALDADLVFFICTEKLCERHKEHVKLAVQAD